MCSDDGQACKRRNGEKGEAEVHKATSPDYRFAFILRSLGNSKGTLSFAFLLLAASAAVAARPVATSFSRSSADGATRTQPSERNSSCTL